MKELQQPTIELATDGVGAAEAQCQPWEVCTPNVQCNPNLSCSPNMCFPATRQCEPECAPCPPTNPCQPVSRPGRPEYPGRPGQPARQCFPNT